MKITLDISMYPLREDYETQILNFIEFIKTNSKFEIRVNALSTQLQGEQKEVMDTVNEAINEVYKEGMRAVFVLKILPGDIDLSYSQRR